MAINQLAVKIEEITRAHVQAELSLHGGCPVEEGVKWAANKWVWNAPMRYVSALE